MAARAVEHCITPRLPGPLQRALRRHGRQRVLPNTVCSSSDPRESASQRAPSHETVRAGHGNGWEWGRAGGTRGRARSRAPGCALPGRLGHIFSAQDLSEQGPRHSPISNRMGILQPPPIMLRAISASETPGQILWCEFLRRELPLEAARCARGAGASGPELGTRSGCCRGCMRHGGHALALFSSRQSDFKAPYLKAPASHAIYKRRVHIF